MKNVLILGGTKFVGLHLVDTLLQHADMRVYVGSRRAIDVPDFILCDRKSTDDLNNIFSKNKFDLVIDFINYSAVDCKKLLSAVQASGQSPQMISISTVYVYGNPQEVRTGQTYCEENFDAMEYQCKMLDRPDVDYSEGKRGAESFLAQNYSPEKTTVLRFPIILGCNDYTRRTHYFHNIITENKKINLAAASGKANYIFSIEAAACIEHFVLSPLAGTFNAVMTPSVSERKLFGCYCAHYNRASSDYLDDQQPIEHSPFYYPLDYEIDDTRLRGHYKISGTFQNALSRELGAIDAL